MWATSVINFVKNCRVSSCQLTSSRNLNFVHFKSANSSVLKPNTFSTFPAFGKQALKNILYQETNFHSTKFAKNLKCSYFIRRFRTSPRRDIHPLIWLVVKPAFKLAAILSGRGFRKWWKDLPPNKRKYMLGVLRKNSVKIGAGIAIFGFLCLYYYESHLQETPLTNRKRFIAFNSEQFEQIGEFEFQQVHKEFKKDMLPANHPACKRVEGVVHRLLKANSDIKEVRNKHWLITVVGSPIENAFVLPNGQIFVFSGMLNLCSNNDQLGTVLAHEMSHCILAHGAENFSFAHLLDSVMIIFIAAIWAILPSDVIALITHWLFRKSVEVLLHLPYNRKIETEADEVGLNLAAKACFDVRESSAFWTKMSALSKNVADVPDIEFLSTHPSHEKRSSYLDGIMDQAIQLRTVCGCPILNSPDPRLDVAKFSQRLEEERRKHHIKTHNQAVVFTSTPPSG